MTKVVCKTKAEPLRQSHCRYDTLNAVGSLRLHWPEYLMEASGLVLYMFSVCVFATLLQHPASPVRHIIVSPVLRRALMGLVVGATLVAIIMTPWGRQSGGHFQSVNNLHFLSAGKGEIVGRLVLRHRTVRWRNLRCCDRRVRATRRGAERSCSLCRDSAGYIRQPRCICCRACNLLYSDEYHHVRIQSHVTGTIHAVFCRLTVCNVHNLRNTAVRDEHEPCANIWVCFLCQLLARALDIFHRAGLRNAGRRGTLFAHSRGSPSLLCEAVPRQ